MAQTSALLLFTFSVKLRVGFKQHGSAVRVGEEILPDKPLEEAALCHLFTQFGERLLEGKSRDGVASVEPHGERAQHHSQTAWKRAGIVFAECKLHRVKRGFYSSFVYAFIGELFQSAENQLFYLVGIFCMYALGTHRESRLAKIAVHPTDHLFAKP